jgi:hypothetical protein
MAYETGAATDLDDLFTKLLTFATANGWTQDADVSADMPALHKNAVFVQFRYDGSSPSGNGRSVGVYQSTAYVGGTKPGGHTDDSGSGFFSASTATDTSLAFERCIQEIGDGPFVYHFFENDASPAYIHCVVRKGADSWRHFGFGELDKFGDWGAGSGGAYCYSCFRLSGTNWVDGSSTYGLDAGMADVSGTTPFKRNNTLRASGFPGQGGTEKWLSFFDSPSSWASASNKDRAAIQRRMALGGVRSGPFSRALGFFRGYPGFSGLVPMTPIGAWYVDQTNLRFYLLGFQKDVRFLNIGAFADGESVDIGGETWIMFPVLKKANGDVTNGSRYAGFAYRKVTA